VSQTVEGVTDSRTNFCRRIGHHCCQIQPNRNGCVEEKTLHEVRRVVTFMCKRNCNQGVTMEVADEGSLFISAHNSCLLLYLSYCM